MMIMANWAAELFLASPVIMAAVGFAVAACAPCGGTGKVWCRPWQTTVPCPHCRGAGKVDFAPITATEQKNG